MTASTVVVVVVTALTAALIAIVTSVGLSTTFFQLQVQCLSIDNSDESVSNRRSSTSNGASASTSTSTSTSTSASNTRRLRHEQYDPLFITRCKAHCWMITGNINYKSSSTNSKCMKVCFAKKTEKPGYCPMNGTILPPFATACLRECYQDFQCSSLLKCCQHSCGITCQPPDALSTIIGLPEIPRDLKIERRKKRNLYIEWKPGGQQQQQQQQHIFYHIEERHHTGRNFIERKLNEWQLCGRTINTSHLLKNFIKPGRWYQFRVAAVNENGTRGFSENVFTFSMSPKPPKAPRNINIGPLLLRNGSVNVRINWSPPVTDWPIQKYKVYWSRRLHGVTALDSVLVKQQIVPKDQTSFILKDLEPNSQYFLQVQAFSQFGKDRLKGEKSGLVLNTTVNETINSQKIDVNIEDLQLDKVYWSNGNLTARIVWTTRSNSIKYTINWWIGPCMHKNNNKNNNHHHHHQQHHKSYTHIGSTTVKTSSFNLYDLQFNCRYRVSIKEMNLDGRKLIEDISINFTTQNCETYTTKINCK